MKIWVLAVLVALSSVPAASPALDKRHTAPRSLRVDLGGGLVAALTEKDGIFLEAVPQKGEGLYAFVTHAFADAEKGAVGLLQVGQPELAAGVGH